MLAHVNEVIDRVVNEYGVGYIKMDYNIEPGIGTELGAESVGQGMLAHEKAYLAWLDDVFARYPDLVIENCSSGVCGLTMHCFHATASSPHQTRRITATMPLSRRTREPG